jgi:hypothetical protein
VETQDRCNMTIEILRATNDGDQLARQHLFLVLNWVNAFLNETEENLFKDLYDQIKAGTYKKPWLHDVENLTKYHAGYIYWKGIQVEHYCFHGKNAWEGEGKAAVELGRRCQILERKGIEVSMENTIWRWDKTKPEGGY